MPGALIGQLIKGTLTLTLPCADIDGAARLGARADRLADLAFALLDDGGGRMLDPGTKTRVITELVRFELEAAELARAAGALRDAAALHADIAVHAATCETLRTALAFNDLSVADAPLAAAFARLGLAPPQEDHDARRLAREALRALIDVADENRRRAQGVYPPTDYVARAEGGVNAPAPWPGTAPPAPGSVLPAGFAAPASAFTATSNRAAAPAPETPATVPPAHGSRAGTAPAIPETGGRSGSDPLEGGIADRGLTSGHRLETATPDATGHTHVPAPETGSQACAEPPGRQDRAAQNAAAPDPQAAPVTTPPAEPDASAPTGAPQRARVPPSAAQPDGMPGQGSPETTGPAETGVGADAATVPEPGGPDAAPDTALPAGVRPDSPSGRIIAGALGETRRTSALTGDSLFSAAFDTAVARKRRDVPGWEKSSLGNWRATRKLFIEAFGDQKLSSFREHHFTTFRALLQALPEHHHKSAASQGIYVIIDEADLDEQRDEVRAENEIAALNLNRGDAEQRRMRARQKRVSVATTYRHMVAIQFIFTHAADHGAVPHGLVRAAIWSRKQKEKLRAEEKDNRRLPWGDKLAVLLATSAFVAPVQRDGQRQAVFWPTLLSAHAGLSEEEALQLTVEDLDTMRDLPVLRIQSGEGQHIKSGNRYRVVPIHKNLITLGFLDFVTRCRSAGQHWLFPDVNRCAAKGRLSGTFTKFFTRYRIAEGVYDPRRDFHSLRTHFNVALKRLGCPLEIRKRLMGHALRDVTETHYDPEGSPIAEFKAWVDRIEIDISHIPRPGVARTAAGGKVISLGGHNPGVRAGP